MINMSIKNKKAILFDSGKVLNRPTTGNWFITPSFYQYISKEVWENLSKEKLNEVFNKAYEYIESQPLIITREEEHIHFKEYFKILLGSLKEISISNSTIECIAHDYVYQANKLGIHFWSQMGFLDSGKIDPDNKMPIYIKAIV